MTLTHPLQMSLQLVLGIICLLYALAERVVDSIELAPHLVGAHPQGGVDLTSQLLRHFTLALRSGDVLLSEFNPGVRDCDAVRAKWDNGPYICANYVQKKINSVLIFRFKH